jgi:hypothetical protein
MNKLQIIETPDYILAVSDKEIQTGYYYNDLDKALRKGYVQQSYHASVVAYQPKGNSPQLDLPLLPELVIECDIERLAVEKFPISKDSDIFIETRFDIDQSNRQYGFIKGYKAATKKYTEEDLREAIKYAVNAGRRIELKAVDLDFTVEKYTEELIQSLKQLKTPKWFVAENNAINNCNQFDIELGCLLPYCECEHDEKYELKTTTINGKTYLVGTYLYE